MRAEILMWKAFALLILRCVQSSSFALIHPFQPRLMYIVDITRTWNFFLSLHCLSSSLFHLYVYISHSSMEEKRIFQPLSIWSKAQSSWTMCVLLCFGKEKFSEIPSFRLEGRTEVSWRGMRWRAWAKFDRIIVDLMWYPSLLFEQRFNRVQRRVRVEKLLVRPPFLFSGLGLIVSGQIL